MLKFHYPSDQVNKVNLTWLNIRNLALPFQRTQPTSHSFCNNSSLRRIEEMLSENVDWNRMQNTRSEKLGISESS